jgi:hypothetical protein
MFAWPIQRSGRALQPDKSPIIGEDFEGHTVKRAEI